MKKLLIGLTLLASMSSFASQADKYWQLGSESIAYKIIEKGIMESTRFNYPTEVKVQKISIRNSIYSFFTGSGSDDFEMEILLGHNNSTPYMLTCVISSRFSNTIRIKECGNDRNTQTYNAYIKY